MQTRLITLCATVAAAACSCGVAAGAAPITVFDNFGPGNGGFEYNGGTSWLIAPGGGFPPVQQAQQFTLGESGALSDIYLGLTQLIPHNGNTVRVRLTDNSGPNPESSNLIEQWTIVNAPSQAGTSVVHLQSILAPVLNAGEQYWIWIEGVSGPGVGGFGGGSHRWGYNTTGDMQIMQQKNVDGVLPLLQWRDQVLSTAGAMRIDIIPSPGTLAIFGLAGFAAARRRRH